MQALFIIFLVVTGVQVIYFTIFLIAFLRKRAYPVAETQPISVIVCAHDEEQNLRELIPLLIRQDYPAFEVIIVNDRSNDGTYDFLLEKTKKEEKLRMVHVASTPQHIHGKKYGITLGIKAAKHNWVLLTDADCRPHNEQWIKSVSEHCSADKEFVLGFSGYEKQKGFLNLFIRFETLFTAIQYISYALTGNPYMGVGRNLAYRKSVFLDNKGFSTFSGITGGDDDLFVNQHANAKNTAVALGENAIVHSFPKTTWKDFFGQKIRHLSVGKKYRKGHQFLLAFFFLTHAATWLIGIPLLFLFSAAIWVTVALVLRVLLVTITTYQAAGRVGQKFEWWAVPLLDFVFVIYYLSTAPVAFLTKKIRWKN